VKKLKIVKNNLRKSLIFNGHILGFEPFANFFTAPDALPMALAFPPGGGRIIHYK
jgi:hypothetical protein